MIYRFLITASLCMIRCGHWIIREKCTVHRGAHAYRQRLQTSASSTRRRTLAPKQMLVRWHAIRAGNWSGTPLGGADQPTMAREQLHIDVESIAGIQPAFDKDRVHGCGGAHPSVYLPR